MNKTQAIAEVNKLRIAGLTNLVWLIPNTKINYSKQTKAEQVKEFDRDFEKGEDCNLGFYPSGEILVVDIDIKNGQKGMDSWKKLKERHPELKLRHTRGVVTASNGYHIYYRVPVGFNPSNKIYAEYPGIEFMYNNNHVVLPPSTVGDKSYRWGTNTGLEQPIAEMPDSLVKFLEAKEQYVYKTQDTEHENFIERLRNSQTGERHNLFLTKANWYAHTKISMKDCKSVLLAIAKDLKLDINHMEKIIEDAYSHVKVEAKTELTAQEKSEFARNVHRVNTFEDAAKLADTILKTINRDETVKFEDLNKQNIETRTYYKIGSSEIDEFPIFSSKQTTIIAGASGTGKTTIALNVCKTLLNNNSIRILYCNSTSENSDEDLQESVNLIGLDITRIKLAKFERENNPYLFFKNILECYQKENNKLPEVVVIDTLEKMRAGAEGSNALIKLNAEDVAKLSNEYPCCFIVMSQLSPTRLVEYANKTKKPSYYGSMMQQGGLDVINNVGQWISFRQIRTPFDGTYIRFYFGKIRSLKNNQRLVDQQYKCPIDQKNLNLDFNLLKKEEFIDA